MKITSTNNHASNTSTQSSKESEMKIQFLEKSNSIIRELLIDGSHFYSFATLNFKNSKIHIHNINQTKSSGDIKILNDALTALQHHDIIRQKLAHIVKINTHMLLEFKSSKNASTLKYAPYFFEMTQYYEKIMAGIYIEITESKQKIVTCLEKLSLMKGFPEERLKKFVSLAHELKAHFQKQAALSPTNLSFKSENEVAHIANELTVKIETQIFYKVFALKSSDPKLAMNESTEVEFF